MFTHEQATIAQLRIGHGARCRCYINTWVLCALIVCGLLCGRTDGQSNCPAQAGSVLNEEVFAGIAPLVRQWIDRGEMAGCVIAIGTESGIVYQRAFGYRSLQPQKVPMTSDTLFDLASLTKPIVTATSVMQLIERGQLRLHDRVATYLPEFGNNGKESITVYHLLTHQGGLTPDNPLSDYEHGVAAARERVMKLPVLSPPGTKFRYSDVGFIVLGWLVERISGQKLNEYAAKNIFAPLGMVDTGFLPPEDLRRRAAITERRDGRWMQGEVHDPRAHLLGGVAGHAGLFSTAGDLAVYARMMLGRGERNGVRILSPRAVEVMTGAYDAAGALRGLGWDKRSGYSSNRGELMTDSAFGHGGFTGTSLWIDPELGIFVVFLSSRLHPDGRGSVNRLAGRIGTVAASAVTRRVQRSGARAGTKTDVLCGIDVLKLTQFDALKGERIGLITNHTGIDRDGKSTAKLLHDAKNVELTALFSPEHGISGNLDVAQIADTQDSRTGLVVHSLYGATRKPTREMLTNVDTLVFDIQDIGCRFYTYISTMGLAMEAAAEHGKRFVVLDRPNPIGGVSVAGPMLDAGRECFVAYHRLPIRHGMTIGELARLFQAEKQLSLDLTIIPVRGWRREMMFDETGLYWVNPSPNMRSLNAALLYPGIGLLETTNLSVGRGTDTPFEVLGAPWLDARRLVQGLSADVVAGVTLTPIRFRPDSSKYRGEECEGIRITVTDRNQLRPIRLGLAVARWLRLNHPDQWDVDSYLRLLGNEDVHRLLRSGASLDEMDRAYRSGLDGFIERRTKFLLYQ